ncbi:hypothetical protein ABZT26_14115 [Streptomyces sp. NPDC005395]|uniref:hypothetical protein n=1 Tax=unclassified Streptomyces TaxID=2593676 RepID=UPI000C9C85D9|nr:MULTISPECIES: hypothetical protein [unclassified Streptomyces]NDZ71766.1 hypothetical protein [Streptomyces sp. SID10362]QUW91839.1 hypothetical protein KE639_03053 [Streptomyces sp. V17-9]WKX20521.1 hypothetical protein Q3Y68_21770 [Streptomyces sp. HUAS CX7]
MSMSESTVRTGVRAGATAVVHESYSFACMRCGHGWEQSFEIEHHTDADGRAFVLYVVDGRVVPSPLTRPTCATCGNHVVRIMRPGRVASVRGTAYRTRRVPPAGPLEVPVVPRSPEVPEQPGPGAPGLGAGHRQWHLTDLLHALRPRRRAS